VAKNNAVALSRSSRRAEGGGPLAAVDGGKKDDAAAPRARVAEEPKGIIPPELDRLIHERMRLGIVSALAVNESLSFTEIRDLMHTTDGNLSVHARKLEEAKYVSCTKSFAGRVPHTVYKLTSPGRRALERYLDHMESIIRATRER
jgi:DNA-binding transcriptional ArsR family regulator